MKSDFSDVMQNYFKKEKYVYIEVLAENGTDSREFK